MIHEALNAAGRCSHAGVSVIGYLERLARQHDSKSETFTAQTIRRDIEMIRLAEKNYLEVVNRQKKDAK